MKTIAYRFVMFFSIALPWTLVGMEEDNNYNESEYKKGIESLEQELKKNQEEVENRNVEHEKVILQIVNIQDKSTNPYKELLLLYKRFRLDISDLNQKRIKILQNKLILEKQNWRNKYEESSKQREEFFMNTNESINKKEKEIKQLIDEQEKEKLIDEQEKEKLLEEKEKEKLLEKIKSEKLLKEIRKLTEEIRELRNEKLIKEKKEKISKLIKEQLINQKLEAEQLIEQKLRALIQEVDLSRKEVNFDSMKTLLMTLVDIQAKISDYRQFVDNINKNIADAFTSSKGLEYTSDNEKDYLKLNPYYPNDKVDKANIRYMRFKNFLDSFQTFINQHKLTSPINLDSDQFYANYYKELMQFKTNIVTQLKSLYNEGFFKQQLSAIAELEEKSTGWGSGVYRFFYNKINTTPTTLSKSDLTHAANSVKQYLNSVNHTYNSFANIGTDEKYCYVALYFLVIHEMLYLIVNHLEKHEFKGKAKVFGLGALGLALAGLGTYLGLKKKSEASLSNQTEESSEKDKKHLVVGD